jgi:hypothetical protein
MKRIARLGFLFRGTSPVLGCSESIRPNKRFEFAPVGRRTRKSDALLLAAQAIRWASEIL